MAQALAPLTDELPIDVDGNFKQRDTQKAADAVSQFMIDQANQTERNAKGRTRSVGHIEENVDASGSTVGKLYKAGTSSPMELLGEKLDEPASAIRAGITANPDATGLDVAKQLFPNVGTMGQPDPNADPNAPIGDAYAKQQRGATMQAAAGFGVGMALDPFNFVNPGGGAAKGAAKLIPKTPVAPTFYSPLQRFIASGKVGNSFTPDQLRGQLAKAGISESEIHWTGLEDVLEGKTKVTKQEVLDHLAANEIQVVDVIKGSRITPEERTRIDGYAKRGYTNLTPAEQADFDKLNDLEFDAAHNTLPKFGDPSLQLPGGENYREVLLTLPATKAEAKVVQAADGKYEVHKADGTVVMDPDGNRAYWSNPTAAEAARQYHTRNAADTFTQGHFEEPNVMAHIRLTDRNISGKKTLFVEEAQSDWDLMARKGGIKEPIPPVVDRRELAVMEGEPGHSWEVSTPDGRKVEVGRGTVANEAEAQEYAERYFNNQRKERISEQYDKVPDFPFRGKWHELAIKRVLRMAAEEGYDSIAWTTGKQQAERYNLQKHIKALSYKVDKNGTYHIVGTLPNGANQGLGQVSADKLVDTVGKDVAQRIHEGKGDVGEHPLDAEHGWKTLSGLDLKIGGEGKNTLYDEIIPSFLNKYGKRWDAKAGKAQVKTGVTTTGDVEDAIHYLATREQRTPEQITEDYGYVNNRDYVTLAQGYGWEPAIKPTMEDVHHFPIPDNLRKSVLEDGQSMFGSSFQAVHEFVRTLDPKQQQEIITALGGDNPPKWLKRLQGEEGGIQTAAAWLLTRMGLGFTAGALTADPEHTIENGLIGAGLFSLASPKIVSQLASIVRKQQPNPAINFNPQQAAAAGHTVGQVGVVPIDWDAVEATAAGATQLIKQIADHHIKANGGKRGHISVEETLDTAKALGMHPDEFERWMSTDKGVAMNRDQLMYGAMALADSQKKNIPSKIAAYAKAGRVPGSPEDVALTNARLLHNEISKQLFGGREEAGGALQILGREPARSAIARENAMVAEADNAALTPGELLKGAQGPEPPQGLQIVSNDAYIKIWQAVEDKGALERSTRTAEQINGWDLLNELVYGDALSSPVTHVQNLLTGAGLNPIATALIRAVASTKARVMGDTTGVVPGEAAAILHGYYTGALGAFKTVRDSYHEGGFTQLWEQLHSLEERGKLEGSGKKAITADNLARILGKTYGHDIHIPYNKPYSFDPNGYIGKAVDIFGTAIRTPSQFLKVGDRFAYAVNFNMAAEAAAWRKAVQSGATDEADLAAAYQQNLARMPNDIRKEAERFAKHEIFQEAITGHPGKLVEGMGHAMLRPFITFVRTPINVMKYNLEGVPLANRLVASTRADYAAGGARAQLAQAKWILGGTVTGLAGIMAYTGRLTGAGPEDPGQRKIWEKAGYKQYSLNVGTDAKPYWLSYRWAEPFATWAGMAADAVYGWNHEASNVQSFIYGVLPTVALNSFTNKTWTKDAMELFAAFKSQAGDTPESKAERWEAYAKTRVKSLVPGASGLAAVTRMVDPVTHEAKTLWEILKKGIPILSSTLPASYDLQGNVRMRDDSLGPDIISPIQTKHEKKDRVAEYLWKNGVSEPPFPKVVGGLEVTAKEKSQLQKLRATVKNDDGETLYDKLRQTIKELERDYPELTKEGRKVELDKVLSGYTNKAMAVLGHTNPKFAKEREAIEKAHKKGLERGRRADDFQLNP